MEPSWLCHAVVFERFQTFPKTSILWYGVWSRVVRKSQAQAGLQSVLPLRHPVNTKEASKMTMTYMKIICWFWWCIVLWQKSPLSVPKMSWSSCNGNYETPWRYNGKGTISERRRTSEWRINTEQTTTQSNSNWALTSPPRRSPPPSSPSDWPVRK